jgi:hypothetical protein
MGIKQKLKPCITCGIPSLIFSKKQCKNCAQKTYKKIKPFTERGVAKRKELRKDFPEFFINAIEKLKLSPFCENCGHKINANYLAQNNVAHCLNKSKYVSVATHPLNWVALCDSKDYVDAARSCHAEFDSNLEKRLSMPVFKIAQEKYFLFSDKCLESGKEKNLYEGS